MDFRISTWTVSIALISLLVLDGLVGPVSSAQSPEATVESSVVFILQGNNDVVPGTESNNDFYALRIVSFNLPYDVTRVYTKVPASARDINVWSTSGEINQSRYGRETSGSHTDHFYIDVPPAHVRTANLTDDVHDEQGFNASGSVFLNTTYTSGALRLINGSEDGFYVSGPVALANAQTIESATPVFSGNSTANITCWLSNNNGTTWNASQNGTPVNFSSEGSSLRARFDLNGNITSGFDPFIASFRVNATYLLRSTIFTVHISYLWTENFSGGETTLDASEALPFAADGSYFLELYLVRGYTAQGEGLVLSFDENGTLSSYPDKDLYYNSTSPGASAPTFSITVLEPEKRSQMLLYSIALGLVVLLGFALAYAKYWRPARRLGPEETSASAGEPVASGGEPFTADDEKRRKELVSRKKGMLSEIEDIKSKMSSGSMSHEAADAELLRLKREFKTVRNELNRLTRKAQAASGPDQSISPESTSSDFEPLLAALARIDDDFERGRLPESTYKTLRKEFVSKAANLMAAKKAGAPQRASPLEAEKGKLMEAIVFLDEEREKGEIDEKVYVELRTSYRKQLVELMKKREEPEE